MNQHNKELEETTIGCLMLYPHLLPAIAPILKDEYLYHNENKIVYRAIMSLFNKSQPVDQITVTMEVNKMGLLEAAGGPYKISTLTRNGDLTVNSIEFNCRKIHEFFILRQLSILAVEIGNAAENATADCFEIVERINNRTAELSNIRNDKTKSVGDIFGEMLTDINNVLENGLPTGLKSGLENLDKVTGGWQRNNLIVVAARPGMGKTALALHLAKYPAINLNQAVAIFSLEMGAKQLVGRLAASEANISSTKINQKDLNRLELQSLGAGCSRLIDCPIYIDDTPNLSISDLRAKAKKLFYDRKIELIIIDYLQLMRGEGKSNREQQVSEISRGLKTLAKELNIPIIALAQLSRECEKREDKRPILSDLRESGSIEQDADIVGFLFRPVYYDMHPNGYEYKDKVLQTENLLLFEFAKGREIKTGEVALKFYGEFMQIENYDLGLPTYSQESKPLIQNNDFLTHKF